MRRIGIRTTLGAAMLLALAASALATPSPNSAVIFPRIFNDCPGSILTTINSYPAQIVIDDVNVGCVGWANLHLRDQIEARNQLDGLVYKVEKDSKEWVDRLSAEAKARLDNALEGGKGALKTGDPDLIRRALDELNGAYSAAGASLYQQAPGAQEAGPEAGGAGQAQAPKADVVEADYEIVDEGKK